MDGNPVSHRHHVPTNKNAEPCSAGTQSSLNAHQVVRVTVRQRSPAFSSTED